MTVAEFISIWGNYFTSNTPITYTYNEQPSTFIALTKINDELKEFKIDIILNKNIKDYTIYSDVYDLSEVSWDTKKIIDTLKIETYDNVYTNTLVINLKGGN